MRRSWSVIHGTLTRKRCFRRCRKWILPRSAAASCCQATFLHRSRRLRVALFIHAVRTLKLCAKQTFRRYANSRPDTVLLVISRRKWVVSGCRELRQTSSLAEHFRAFCFCAARRSPEFHLNFHGHIPSKLTRKSARGRLRLKIW